MVDARAHPLLSFGRPARLRAGAALRRLVGSSLAPTLGLLFIGAQASGCIPESLRTFEVPADTTVDVPGSPIGGSSPVAPETVFPPGALNEAIQQALAQSFSTEGLDKDAIDSLKLTEMRIVAEDAVENENQV